jgi:hypothetical protein
VFHAAIARARGDVGCAGLADIRTLLSRQAGDSVQVSSHPSPLFRFILRFLPFDLTFSL